MNGYDPTSIRKRQYLSYACSVPFITAGIVGLVTNRPEIAIFGTVGIYALVNATSLIDDYEHAKNESLDDLL